MRLKQKRPRWLSYGLGSGQVPSEYTLLQQLAAFEEEDARAAPSSTRRPKKKSKVTPKAPLKGRTEVRSHEQSAYGICSIVFSSPWVYELGEGASQQLKVQIVQPDDQESSQQGSQHPITCLSVQATHSDSQHAADTGPGAQVLLPMPDVSTAHSFIRLVNTGKILLSVTPCTQLPDLLDAATSPAGHAQQSGFDLQQQETSNNHKIHHSTNGNAVGTSTPNLNNGLSTSQLTAPLVLKSYSLTQTRLQTANPNSIQQPTPSSPSHVSSTGNIANTQFENILQMQQLVSESSARSVIRQGLDVCCPAAGQLRQTCSITGQSSKPTQGILDNTELNDVLAQESQPWPAAYWLSSRVSALLLPLPEEDHRPQPTTATGPEAPENTGQASNPVLLPGPEDGIWQLNIFIKEELVQKSQRMNSQQAATPRQQGPDNLEANGTGIKPERKAEVSLGIQQATSETTIPSQQPTTQQQGQPELVNLPGTSIGKAPPAGNNLLNGTNASSVDGLLLISHLQSFLTGEPGTQAVSLLSNAVQGFQTASDDSPADTVQQDACDDAKQPTEKLEDKAGSLLDPEGESKAQWQDDMLIVLRWLMPHTAHLIYHTISSHNGYVTPTSQAGAVQGNNATLLMDDHASHFSAAALYTAVKPAGHEPEFDGDVPELQPELRPYQKRAVAWMLAREQGRAGLPDGQASQEGMHPLWRAITCLDGQQLYLNPITGLLRAESQKSAQGKPSSVKGGILCDEMGLGKTVELLACILANRFRSTNPVNQHAPVTSSPSYGHSPATKRRRVDRTAGNDHAGGGGGTSPAEHIDCPCGYRRSDPEATGGYRGLWVMCDRCKAWQHGACVGVKRLPRGTPHVCSSCMRQKAMQQVTDSCGATLIVCPPAILTQWWNEIHKHCKAGAVRIVVYSGQMQSAASASVIAASTWAEPDQHKSGGMHSVSSTFDTQGQGNRRTTVPMRSVISAEDLAAADIVLTTYDALKRDLDRQPDLESTTKTFRRQKRYHVIPTPLTRLCWWRVVLDEAQMVESSTAKAAAMALKLQAVHRWCVTGTPISRGLEDVYGLMAFLKVRPWSSQFWWMRGIQRPCEAGNKAGLARLLTLLKPSLGGLMWRTAKKDVLHELGIPPQHNHVTWLTLSPIERHFYLRQHQDCATKIRAVLPPSLLAEAARAALKNSDRSQQPDTMILDDDERPRDVTLEAGKDIVTQGIGTSPLQVGDNSWAIGSHQQSTAVTDGDQPAQQHAGKDSGVAANDHAADYDRPLSQVEQKKVMIPLLRLRQAACHPQVGAGGIRSNTAQKAPMTMEEILQVLMTKAKVEAEEAQRALIASLNGLAALMLLEGAVGAQSGAVAAYREALQAMEANKPDIDTDPLQKLHTLYNLQQLLTGPAIPGIAHTLRDATLQGDIDAIKIKYLGQRKAALDSKQYDYDKALKSSQPFHNHQGWFLQTLDTFIAHGKDSDLVDLVKQKLQEDDTYNRKVSVNASSLARRFKSAYQLKIVLVQTLDDIEASRVKAMNKLQALITATEQASPEFVEQAGHCHRCRSELGQRGRLCEHCVLDELFIAWEVRLFALVTRAMAAGDEVTPEEAAKRAQAALIRTVGRGGLGEKSHTGDLLLDDDATDTGGRDRDGVSESRVTWKPSEVEQALKLIYNQLRSQFSGKSTDADQLITLAKDHLDKLEAQRKLFAEARALSLTQRQVLYAHDELEMAVARIRIRQPDEWVADHEQNFKIFPEEIPIRNKDFSNDKVIAVSDLKRTLGTLRYLRTLQAARQTTAGQDAVNAEAVDLTATDIIAETATSDNDPQGANTGIMATSTSDRQRAVAGQQQDHVAANSDSNQLLTTGLTNGDQQEHPSTPKRQQLQSTSQGEQTPSSPAIVQQRQQLQGTTIPASLQQRFKQLQQQQKQRTDSKGSSQPVVIGQVCPICHDPLASHFAMLPCGHMMCCACTDMLVERVPHSLPAASRKISCPNCRVRIPLAEISYVDGGGSTKTTREAAPRTVHRMASDPGSPTGHIFSSPQHTNHDKEPSPMLGDMWAEEADIRVSGSYGTKVEAVVRRVMYILQSDPAAKVVVFSAWLDLLEVVAHAFATNKVPYALPKARSGFQAALAAFKGSTQSQSAAGQPTTQAGNNVAAGLQSIDEQEETVEDKQAQDAAGDGVDNVDNNTITGAKPGMDATYNDDPNTTGILEQARNGSEGDPSMQEQPVQQGFNDQEMAQDDEQPSEQLPGNPPPTLVQSSGATRGRKRKAGPAAMGKGKKRGKGAGQTAAAGLQQGVPPRVLLLLLSQGAAGLNITEAQHVVLIEPRTEPGVELQAVGRVHRIGQTRETHVHRFVVQHTVEENVHALGASRAAAMDMNQAAASTSTRQAKESIMRVCDVALLLTTPWSSNQPHVLGNGGTSTTQPAMDQADTEDGFGVIEEDTTVVEVDPGVSNLFRDRESILSSSAPVLRAHSNVSFAGTSGSHGVGMSAARAAAVAAEARWRSQQTSQQPHPTS